MVLRLSVCICHVGDVVQRWCTRKCLGHAGINDRIVLFVMDGCRYSLSRPQRSGVQQQSKRQVSTYCPDQRINKDYAVIVKAGGLEERTAALVLLLVLLLMAGLGGAAP